MTEMLKRSKWFVLSFILLFFVSTSVVSLITAGPAPGPGDKPTLTEDNHTPETCGTAAGDEVGHGDPVNLQTGEYYFSVVDLPTKQRSGFYNSLIKRYYRSHMNHLYMKWSLPYCRLSDVFDTPCLPRIIVKKQAERFMPALPPEWPGDDGWDPEPHVSGEPQEPLEEDVTRYYVMLGNGRTEHFVYYDCATENTPIDLMINRKPDGERIEGKVGVQLELRSKSVSELVLIDKEGSIYTFTAPTYQPNSLTPKPYGWDTGWNSSGGQKYFWLSEIEDRSGNKLTWHYSTTTAPYGRLDKITDTMGRDVTFYYFDNEELTLYSGHDIALDRYIREIHDGSDHDPSYDPNNPGVGVDNCRRIGFTYDLPDYNSSVHDDVYPVRLKTIESPDISDGNGVRKLKYTYVELADLPVNISTTDSDRLVELLNNITGVVQPNDYDEITDNPYIINDYGLNPSLNESYDRVIRQYSGGDVTIASNVIQTGHYSFYFYNPSATTGDSKEGYYINENGAVEYYKFGKIQIKRQYKDCYNNTAWCGSTFPYPYPTFSDMETEYENAGVADILEESTGNIYDTNTEVRILPSGAELEFTYDKYYYKLPTPPYTYTTKHPIRPFTRHNNLLQVKYTPAGTTQDPKYISYRYDPIYNQSRVMYGPSAHDVDGGIMAGSENNETIFDYQEGSATFATGSHIGKVVSLLEIDDYDKNPAIEIYAIAFNIGDQNGDSDTSQKMGNVIKATQFVDMPAGLPSSVVKTITNDDIDSKYQYNNHGQLIREISYIDDSNSVSNSYEFYDIPNETEGGYLKKIIKDEGGINATTEMIYDDVGNVIEKIDPSGNHYTYTINKLDLLEECFGPNDAVYGGKYHAKYIYNKNCILIQKVTDIYVHDDKPLLQQYSQQTRKIVEDYFYDKLNRPVEYTRSLSVNGIITESIRNPIRYDRAGNEVLKVSPISVDGANITDNNYCIESKIYDSRRLVISKTNGGIPSDFFNYQGNSDLVDDLQQLGVDPTGISTTSTVNYEYDQSKGAFLTKQIDPKGNITEFTYNEYGKLEKVTSVSNNIWNEYEYDVNDNVVLKKTYGPAVINGSSVCLCKEEMKYDSLGRVYFKEVKHFDLQIGEQSGSITSGSLGKSSYSSVYIERDRLSRTFRTVDDNLNESITTYDNLGRSIESELISSASTNKTYSYYDLNGRLIHTESIMGSTSNPANNKTCKSWNFYDLYNRVIAKVDAVDGAEGHANYYRFDSMGNTVYYSASKDTSSGNCSLSSLDSYNQFGLAGYSSLLPSNFTVNSSGVENLYEFDGRCNLVKEIKNAASSNSNIVNEWTYDLNSRKETAKDGEGNITTYSYDAKNRLKQITNSDSISEHFIYDNNDNVIYHSDGNGVLLNNIYDSLDRLIGVNTITAQNAEVIAQQFNYDGLGNVLKARDYNFSQSTDQIINYKYDSLGNVLESNITYKKDGVIVQSAQILGNYDKVGNVQNMTYPDNRTLAFDYFDDSAYRLSAITDSKGTFSAFEYIGGVVESRTLNTINSFNVKTNVSYDLLNRIEQIENMLLGSPNVTLSKYEYDYDKANNLLYEKRYHRDVMEQVGSVNTGDAYFYDDFDRVTEARYQSTNVLLELANPGSVQTALSKMSYDIDMAGNWEDLTDILNVTKSNSDNNMNEYSIFWNNLIQLHDNNGQRTESERISSDKYGYYYDSMKILS